MVVVTKPRLDDCKSKTSVTRLTCRKLDLRKVTHGNRRFSQLRHLSLELVLTSWHSQVSWIVLSGLLNVRTIVPWLVWRVIMSLALSAILLVKFETHVCITVNWDKAVWQARWAIGVHALLHWYGADSWWLTIGRQIVVCSQLSILHVFFLLVLSQFDKRGL